MKFADNLRNLRKLKKISQEELAEKVGVSRQSVSKWENSESYPEMNNILELCKIFNCNINELVNDAIVDFNELDEEVQMSAVKFKKEKQKKVKVLSKIISVVALLGKVCTLIAMPCIVLAMIIVPILISKINIKNDSIVIDGKEADDIVEEEDGLKLKYKDQTLIVEDNQEQILLFKDIMNNNSKESIIAYLELSCVVGLICLGLMLMVFRHLQKLFRNIYGGDTPFTLENVDHIKKMAYCLIVVIVVPFIGGIISDIVFNRDLGVQLEVIDWIQILFLFILAYIFEYGYEIQLESKEKMYGNVDE